MIMLAAFGVAALPVVVIYRVPVLGVSSASATLLTAVYGIGNLAGSAGVMARPIQLTPYQTMPWCARFCALALVLVAASGSFHFAMTAYFVAGCINAYLVYRHAGSAYRRRTHTGKRQGVYGLAS